MSPYAVLMRLLTLMFLIDSRPGDGRMYLSVSLLLFRLTEAISNCALVCPLINAANINTATKNLMSPRDT